MGVWRRSLTWEGTTTTEPSELRSGFQPGGHAWDPKRYDIPELLATSTQTRMQPIYYGSNHTFLVTLDAGQEGKSLAVYKPARGEYPLYDFPTGTLYKREVATWVLSCMLGWQVIPPTVVAHGKHGIGSVQLYIEAEASGEIDADDLRKLVLIDLMANNADRKAEHCLPGPDNSLWGIDHGLTFNVAPKLRTVLWHFAGEPIGDDEQMKMLDVVDALDSPSEPLACSLRDLLSPQEIRALSQRAERLVDFGEFPNPRYKPVPYRW